MRLEIDGRARRFGDDINTDYIIASSRKRDTLSETVLARYLLETVDPAFAASVQSGDLLVAGRNFGCGSAMEIAATVIMTAGIQAVLAESFARTFYRNAVNNGLIPVECDTRAIREGDRLAITLAGAELRVANRTTGSTVNARPFAGIILEILEAGGLVEHVRRRKDEG
jgi:3-isopropylmalate/(R)-2-methylmalate dehydratase small subunit